ncbi:hypothetical protein ACFQ3J_25635 [Paenibacillus provencensis]|uniref:Transposase n=1 Tax=Paenibacillus provencensis TaxID=441151 RepID=A0ABW3PXX3_9BACL|nr:hypothetical protein [Paenibacillus sp. MER 78]MCM3130736.1 hypothetical protein [Paenibacillus sp. MER 78]
MSAVIGDQATYYQYRLIRKINISRPILLSYLSLTFIMLLASFIFFSWSGLWYFLLSCVTMVWIHYLVARSTLLLSNRQLNRWQRSWRVPWVGLIPSQHIAYPFFSRIHLHMTWIGLVFIFVFIIASPPAFAMNLFFWHVWLMAPRLMCILWLFRERKDGYLKITQQEVAYYIQ